MIRNRHFSFLLVVNLVTTLAIELFTVTVLVAVFEQTNSTLQTAGAMVARSLPAFLLGPVAGVLVDRFPRKNVVISMDVIRLLLVGVSILFLRDDGQLPIVAIYLILMGLSAADVFHRPANIALIPSLVTQEQLVQANSMMMVLRQVMMAMAYALGGWIVQIVPLSQVAIAVAILFALGIVVAALIVVPKRQVSETDTPQESLTESFMSGLRYLRQHPIARPLTIMETVEHLPHGIWTQALLLAFTIQALQGTTADWGYQVTGYFTGMILGSFAAIGMSDWLSRHPGRVIVSTAGLAGVMTLVFAMSPTIWVATAMAFLFGPPFAIRDVAQDALLQSTVDEAQLGRVYATREMLRMAVFMFAGVFFAWLSEFMPIRTIYVIGGVIYILTGIYAFSVKAVRESKVLVAPASN